MKVSQFFLAICLLAVVKCQFIDYDELAGDYGMRKRVKKLQRSTAYQQTNSGQQPPQPTTNYGQQNGAGYQQPAGAYEQPAANSAYQTEKPAATYGKDNAASKTYDTKEKGMPYDFSWAVKDEPSNNDYAHQEKSDGEVVTGSYRVLLPDGRTQIVTYRVQGDSGFVAEVKYEGEAKPYVPSAKSNSYDSAGSSSGGYQGSASKGSSNGAGYGNQEQQGTATASYGAQSSTGYGEQKPAASVYAPPTVQQQSTNYGQSSAPVGGYGSSPSQSAGYDNQQKQEQPTNNYGPAVTVQNNYGSSGSQQGSAYGGAQKPADSYSPPPAGQQPSSSSSSPSQQGYQQNKPSDSYLPPPAAAYPSQQSSAAPSYEKPSDSYLPPPASSAGQGSASYGEQVQSSSYEQPTNSYLPPPPTYQQTASTASITPAYQGNSAQPPADSYLPPTPTYQSAGTASAASNYGAAQQLGASQPSDSYLPLPTAVFQQQPAAAYSSGSSSNYSNRQGLSAESVTETYSSSVIDGQLFHGDYHQKVASTTASYGEAASTFYNQGSASSKAANYPASNALGANSYNRARSVVYSPVGWRLF